jgi:hypothetical protein
MARVKTGINCIVAFLEKRFTLFTALFLQLIVCFIVVPASGYNKQDNPKKQKNEIMNQLHTPPSPMARMDQDETMIKKLLMQVKHI